MFFNDESDPCVFRGKSLYPGFGAPGIGVPSPQPTRTKTNAARLIFNRFSKIRILREAENTYCSFPARK